MGLKPGIVWIASYPKSGNTWTRAFLHNLLRLLEGKDGPVDINAMNEYSTTDRHVLRYAKLAGKDAKELTRDDVARLRPQVQEMIADEGDGLTLLKTHNCLALDKGYPTINPKATSGAIYIVRNPLDVAISFANHLGKTIDEAIEVMNTPGVETPITEKGVYEIYGSWSEHVESWTRKKHRAIYVMRYEDMLADPMKTFGNLARHLLLFPTQEQLRKAIEYSSFRKLKEQEEKKGFRERPEVSKVFFRSGKSGEWREKLTPEQVEKIVSAHKEQMKRFGYYPL